MPSEKGCDAMAIVNRYSQSCDTDMITIIDAYLSMKSERDKYKAIVGMIKAAHREVADDGRVWAECRDIDKVIALALRGKES